MRLSTSSLFGASHVVAVFPCRKTSCQRWGQRSAEGRRRRASCFPQGRSRDRKRLGGASKRRRTSTANERTSRVQNMVTSRVRALPSAQLKLVSVALVRPVGRRLIAVWNSLVCWSRAARLLHANRSPKSWLRPTQAISLKRGIKAETKLQTARATAAIQVTSFSGADATKQVMKCNRRQPSATRPAAAAAGRF